MHQSIKDIMVFLVPGGWGNRELKDKFWQLASYIAENYEGPEVTVGLRKLIEAKECFIRAAHTTETKKREENAANYEPPLVEP